MKQAMLAQASLHISFFLPLENRKRLMELLSEWSKAGQMTLQPTQAASIFLALVANCSKCEQGMGSDWE